VAESAVKVNLAADVSDYTADLARAAAQTRGLGDESRKTRSETKGVGDESSKASVALRKLSDAAGAAQLAQLRLNEARERGKSSGASMLALTQRLERAQRDLADAQTVAIKATGDNDAVQRTLAESMARAVRSAVVQSELERGGEDSGGTLARGMRQGLTRNSPLIVAGISGALAAGAPVAIAGATALFGGIGIVAAAQSGQVKNAWSSTWNSIKTGAEADASVLQGTLIDMASQIEKGFSSIRPALRLMFADAAPLLDQFVGSLVNATQNAMPGLVAAVHSAAPVFDGLGKLVEDIGTGLSDFFQAISEHSDAAGEAFASIGQIVRELLPILGDLLGEGAELAQTVLPPLAKVLGVVGDVLHEIAPILPEIALGLAGFKVVGALDGPLLNLATRLGKVTEDGTAATGVLGRISGALPAVGVAVGVVGFAFETAQRQIDDWATALLQGGAAAEQARVEMKQQADSVTVLNSGYQGGLAHLLGYGTGLDIVANQGKAAEQAAKDQYAAMSPLEQAQVDVTAAQNDLTQKVKDFGAESPQAALAAGQLESAHQNLAYQEDLTKGAIDGVTQAMIDQYNQALAATNSSFGYRDAQNQVADAQNNLNDVQSHLNDTNEATRTTTDDVARAGLQLEEALYRQATAAGQLASDALPATAGELEHNTAAAQGTLAELYKMRDQMGSAFPASLQQTITNLEQTGVHLDTTTGQAQGLTDTVNGIPTMHSIHVDADLGPAQAKMDSFINKHWAAIISTNVEGSGTTGGGGTTKRLAAGGPVRGPGTSTSDSIPALLSNDEHVLTAREVQAAGGHQAVISWRKSLVRRFADGGPVSKDWSSILVDADMSGAEAGMTAARRALGASLVSAAAGSGGGAARWSALVLQALALEGQPASLLAATLRRMNQESGGNPRAINLWDSNAKRGTPSKGLMQVIDPTFRAYHDPRTSWDIYDPLANVAASMRYAMARYGSLSAAYNRAGGYELGTPYVPTTDIYQLHRGERVLTARENEAYSAGVRSRESSWSGSGGGSSVSVSAPQVRVFIGDRELTDIVRVEAQGVTTGALQTATSRTTYAATR
jgi:hypothetical protein